MRKLILLALLGAIATVVVKNLPDIQRYRRMRAM